MVPGAAIAAAEATCVRGHYVRARDGGGSEHRPHILSGQDAWVGDRRVHGATQDAVELTQAIEVGQHGGAARVALWEDRQHT